MARFDIDSEQLRQLAELLRETGLTEIELSDGDRRLRLTRAAIIQTASMEAVGMKNIASVASAGLAQPVSAPSSTSASTGPHPGAITSPMVGTAYIAPEPGAKPFVQVGEQVKAGQTLLIIEAMKVMNPIKAPRPGTVVEVLIKDSQPVEFGEAMMIIE
jgi:acetyl-CoA carboxylase biotin carboxyl carrier protein